VFSVSADGDVSIDAPQMAEEPDQGFHLGIRHCDFCPVIVSLAGDSDGCCVGSLGVGADGVCGSSLPDGTVLIHLEVVTDADPAPLEMPAVDGLYRGVCR